MLLDKINPAEQVLRFGQKVLGVVNRQILEDVDKLADKEFIQQLEKHIGMEHTGLIVRKNRDIIYISEPFKQKAANVSLSPFKGEDIEDTYPDNEENQLLIIRLYDFYFSEGSEGSIFLCMDLGSIKKNVATIQFGFTILSAIILVITNGVLTIWVYKSIINPLRKLESAANSIKEGNLNHSIENEFKDEFGEVIESFEEMRRRLKSSTQLQHQYEENRKILLSNISHDLKTPITSIKGYVEGIRDGVADTPEKMEKYINTIYKKASEMDALIDNLSLFSKLDLQKYPFDFKKLNIVEYLKDIVEEIRFDVDKKDIELTLKHPDKSILVTGDINNLRRVIVNIIDNSIKYAGKQKLAISVQIVERKNDVLIEIKDNGRGISNTEINHIFDRFYRADPSRNTDTPGSGLGLAIVKKIIEEHGGTVWAESKVNNGTSIFFTLKKINEG